MRHTPEDLTEIFERVGLAGEFEPQAWIGEGGSAQVFRAVHRVTGQVVALKVWDRLSQDQRRRFLREVEVMRQATSGRRDDETCVVHLLWAAETRGTVYPVAWVAMGLYECSVADRLKSTVPLTGPEALRICQDLLTGLSTLQEAGIVHRDVKPGNVLLRDGRAAITDFGLAARSLDEMTCLNAGTPGYVAPELDGHEPTEPSVRSDLYAAGVTIRAVLRHSNGGEVPRAVEQVLARATEPYPDRRYGSALEMRRAFDEAFLGGADQPTHAPEQRRWTSLPRADLRRRVTLPMLAALLAAIALGVALTVPLPGAGKPSETSPTATLGPVSGADTVRDKECFAGEVTLQPGEGLLLAQRHVDAVDGQWGIVRVSDLPPAGTRGPWRVTQFFGVGDAAVGQRFEVQLAMVPAHRAPRGLPPRASSLLIRL